MALSFAPWAFVVDVEFPTGDLPSIHNALKVNWKGSSALILEVQEHVNANTVRTVAMGDTAGLQRGLVVWDTGGTHQSSCWTKKHWGRMFNVLGEPIDGKEPLPEDTRTMQIHAKSPALRDQRVVTTPFITGIKAIDLLLPYPRGGKIGLFGGAGVGKNRFDHRIDAQHQQGIFRDCAFSLV